MRKNKYLPKSLNKFYRVMKLKYVIFIDNQLKLHKREGSGLWCIKFQFFGP